MKITIKKIVALILTLIMLVSVATVPASAVNVYEENTYGALVEVYDYGNEDDKNFFEKIADLIHWYVARIFVNFDADCPFCGEHFMLPTLENDIEDYYNDAVNSIKNYKGKLTVTRKKSVDIEITDVSAHTFNSALKTVAESLCVPTETTYIFENGTDSDGVKITDVIQPFGRNASLVKEGSQSSSAITSDYATKIENLTVCLVDETSQFDGTTVRYPEYNFRIIEPINPAALELGPITIYQAEMTYTDTVVWAKFNEEEKAESIIIRVPVDATFTAGIGEIKFRASCRAEITEEYTIIYG